MHVRLTPLLQVTPLLNLLRHHLRLLAQGSTAVPRVHLIWASRSLAELKMLGQDLLEASAPSGNGTAPPAKSSSQSGSKTWLETSLYYTGFEQEVDASSVKLMPRADSSDRHSPRSSEDALATCDSLGAGKPAAAARGGAWKPAALLRSSPAYNPLVYALSTLVGFFGSWAGLLAASYYDNYYARTTAEGSDYLSVSAPHTVGAPGAAL